MKKTSVITLIPGIFLSIFLMSVPLTLQAKVKIHSISSPDGKLEMQIVTETGISFCLLHEGTRIVSSVPLSMTLQDGRVLGPDARLVSAKKTTVSETIPSPLYRKSEINAQYNQIDFTFKNGWGLQFRLYDQGAAYRFYTTMKGDISIKAETAGYLFDKDYACYVPYAALENNTFSNSFENIYKVTPMSGIDPERLAFLPLLVCLDKGYRMALTESDLESYPGMYLRGEKSGQEFALKGVFAPVPSETKVHPYRGQVMPVAYSDALANTKGTRTYPWRIMAFANNDTELPVNDMVYALGAPCRIENADWIKPGKVAWDWWNNWGITGVDFPVGINTQTYKYFIDFAAANDLEYVVLDEGWSSPSEGNILKSIPEIDLKELATYARGKKVDLILWCVAYVLDKNLEEACRLYSEMGYKGFKVDFVNRDDQEAVDLNYRIAAMAAKYHMLVDFHGMYKPAGFNRTYPNVINFEGIFGLEQSKWSKEDMVSFDVTFPYIRMMAGPVDYTQGGMRNAVKADFFPVYNNPMAAGTRAHQVATYVVFDSPLVMLCDNPTTYMKEQETTTYIAGIPTEWDETRIVDGKIGEYIVSVRRHGDNWYAGALTNWTPRTITLDLSFLEPGRTYKARIFRDGVNSHRHATDYKVEEREVTSKDSLTLRLSPGGGFAICF